MYVKLSGAAVKFVQCTLNKKLVKVGHMGIKGVSSLVDCLITHVTNLNQLFV